MKINRECPVCGVIYKAETQRLKHGRQTTCSRDCSYEFRANKLKNSVNLTCATCGCNFTRPVSQIKGKYNSQFCSRSCHYRGRTLGKSLRIVKKPYNISESAIVGWRKGAQKVRKIRMERDNYKHTEATKAALRDANCRAIAEGRVGTPSSLEYKVVPILESMGINFIHQYPIRDKLGRFVCVFDFFIPENNIVIEVNGTFWHFDKRVYPDGPVHDIQKRNAIKWERKIGIIKDLGYTLVELWEKDIKEFGEEYILNTLLPVA